MEASLSDIAATADLADKLSTHDVKQLVSYLNPPSALFQNARDGHTFLSSMKNWENRDPNAIYRGIHATRPDLVPISRKIGWLSIATRGPTTPMQKLLKILKTDISTAQWEIIGTSVEGISKEATIDLNISKLAGKGFIRKDLTNLAKLMEAVKRNDIAEQLRKLEPSFREMSDEEFSENFRKELPSDDKELQTWDLRLRKFLVTQHKKVKQHLDDEEEVSIESVYVPLTIIKQKPRPVDPQDETTYSEIAFLRKIAKKEIDVTPVDFTEEISEYDPSQPEIWCLIGNPGSGKSFLCQRTSLRFGRGELAKFSYSISVPCRDADWHQMERDREGKAVDGDFIQDWLCLSMPVGPSWPKELAKHLLESDGEGLLLIIDSMDEYIKEVPFQQTLLHLLLTRKTLSQSTIVLTSRPGAYTSISSAHDLRIDRFYQVLGFSPENRDLYFRIQLPGKGKLAQLQRIFYLHEEVSHLSLVPVNASLFAALIRGSDELSAQTLTRLYSHLIAYLIRRQLSRMGLTEMAEKKELTLLDASVLECLHRIGELAYLGVYGRDLISSKDILLKLDKEERSCQCLGLAEEHFKRDQLGGITRVWSFSHLTIQEFVGAVWLRKESWRDQCLSCRYISNSADNFSIFKMVIRFLCGLLAENSSHVLTILYKHHPTPPVSMQDMPMCYQLNYFGTNMPELMGWTNFTDKFVSLSELLFETSCASISKSFSDFDKFLPQSPCFYLKSATPPNEWECFLKSLPLLHSIQLIYFDIKHVPLTQFRALLASLTSCSLRYLAVEMYDQDYSTLSEYSNAIRECQPPSDTKISLELFSCDLTTTESADLSPTSIFTPFSSLCLFNTNLTPQSLQYLANQLISTDNLYFYPSASSDSSEYKTLLPCLNTAQLTGLHLYSIPTDSIELLETLLTQQSNIQEIVLIAGTNTYSLLPYISKLSNLKHLDLSTYEEPRDSELKLHLIQLLSASADTLRGLRLRYLHRIGLNSCAEVFSSLSSCSSLVQIELYNTELQPDDVIPLSTAVSKLRLLYLCLDSVPLSESGMSCLCRGLLCHPTLRRLDVWDCKLNSNSCVYLTRLISTLKHFKTLDMFYNNLSKPDPEPVKVLEQTADMYSVTHRGLD